MTNPTAKPVFAPKDLIVIEYMTDKAPHKELSAWQKDRRLFAAQACARQMWMATAEDMKSFPQSVEGNPKVRIRSGVEAYQYFLEYFSGNVSQSENGEEYEKNGESHVVSQLKAAWKEFETKNPEQAHNMHVIWENLVQDMRTIRTTVSQDMKPARIENSARELSGQKKGDKVLIIGSVSRNGQDTEGNVAKLAKVLANNRDGRVSEIMITHPEPQALKALEKALLELQKEKSIAADVKITPIPFDSDELIHQGYVNAANVYVTYPMGKDEAIDKKIIGDWNTSRLNSQANLIQLRGAPHLKGQSTELWKSSDIHNYISPEQIAEHRKAALDRNADLSKQVKVSCENCAHCRVEHGKAPIAKLLALPLLWEDYADRAGIVRNGNARQAG